MPEWYCARNKWVKFSQHNLHPLIVVTWTPPAATKGDVLISVERILVFIHILKVSERKHAWKGKNYNKKHLPAECQPPLMHESTTLLLHLTLHSLTSRFHVRSARLYELCWVPLWHVLGLLDERKANHSSTERGITSTAWERKILSSGWSGFQGKASCGQTRKHSLRTLHSPRNSVMMGCMRSSGVDSSSREAWMMYFKLQVGSVIQLA